MPDAFPSYFDIATKLGVIGCLVLWIVAILKGKFITRIHHDEVVNAYRERLEVSMEETTFWREAWRATDAKLDRSAGIVERVVKP